MIFVVDDEPVIASTLTAILKVNGYDARCFVNPLEALEAIPIDRPDLLITDVIMPDLSGIDLAVRVTEQLPTCKVLLFSGHAYSIDLLNAARKCGRDFQLLSKPIHPKDLLAEIKDN